MEMDEEGYFYPKVDEQSCIECNLCTKTCPILKESSTREFSVKAFAVQNIDEKSRINSSSGGAFSVIAEYVISQGGYVFGCKFDKDFDVVHDCATTIDEMSKFRGSKYVQSRLGNSFVAIKQLLKEQKLVLFSGTPCQVAGLQSFLKKEYSNLILVDLVCHGIPSPGLWKKYIDYIKSKSVSALSYVSFRNKQFGYAGSTMAMGYENGKMEYSNRKVQFYKHMFFQDINTRPSCFNCHFKGIKRVSDFTIFDCWHMNKINQEWDDDKGATWMIVQSEKGYGLFDKIKVHFRYKEENIETAIRLDGELALHSTTPNPLREQFFQDYNQIVMEELIKKYFPLSIKKRITFAVKPWLHKFGLLSKLKRLMG